MARLGDLLVRSGVVSRDVVDRALTRSAGRRLASTLVEEEGVAERAVCRALARARGHPCIALGSSVLSLEVLDRVPAELARAYGVLPLALDDEAVQVAAADVDTRAVWNELALVFARRVEPLLAVDSVLARTIDAAYAARAAGQAELRGPGAERDAAHLEIVRPVPDDAEARVADLLAGSSTALAALRRAARSSSAPEPAPAAAPVATATEGVIVVVEDDDAIRGLIRKTLEHEGHTVVDIARGDAAARRLRTLSPRLVVLDAMLPGVHGFELCRELKRSQRLCDVPVLMVSAVYRGWERAREALEVHGADAFLEKPFTMMQLRTQVGALLDEAVPVPTPSPASLDAVALAQQETFAAREQGRVDDALAAVERWLQGDPFDAVAHLQRGQLFLAKQDYDAALRALQNAVLYDRELYAARASLAAVYEMLGFVRRATETWSVAARLASTATSRDDAERRAALLRGGA